MTKGTSGTAQVSASLKQMGSSLGASAVSIASNTVRLVNPLFWKSVLDMFVDGKFLNPRVIIQALLAVLLPTIILMSGSPDSSAALKLALLSPWSIGSALPALTQTTLISFVVVSWGLKRSAALPEAVAALDGRIADERAYRTRRYDVYLPSTSTKKSKDSQQGIVLIPGALMDHRSYSEIAGRLADEGFLVLVLSLEPLRVAVKHGGANPSDVQKSIEQTLKKTGLVVDEWILAAHSQGTIRAIDLPGELAQASNKHKLSISKIALWARGNHPFETAANKVLLLQGGEDPFMAMGDREQMEEFLRGFTHSKEVIVKGADHHQFGSYRPFVLAKKLTLPTSKSSHPKKDDSSSSVDASIMSRKQQQDITAQLTAKFCRDELPLN